MILLTGATGFLGQFVLQELLNQGFEITVLTRAHNNIAKRYPQVKWIKGDLSKPGSLKKIPSPSDGIVHLASTLSIRPDTALDVDVKGMLALMEIWNKGPFIFISSTDVYGPLRKIPAHEEHPLMPSNWYGFGKSICEQALQLSERMTGNDNFVIFRAPYILGPHHRFQTSLIGRLISHAMAGGDFIFPIEWNEGERVFGHSWVNAREPSSTRPKAGGREVLAMTLFSYPRATIRPLLRIFSTSKEFPTGPRLMRVYSLSQVAETVNDLEPVKYAQTPSTSALMQNSLLLVTPE